MTQSASPEEVVEFAKREAAKALPVMWQRGAAQKDCEFEDVAPVVLAVLAALPSCGWQAVPVEAAKEMLAAYRRGMREYIESFTADEREAKWARGRKRRGSYTYDIPEDDKARARYAAMLRAAPTLPGAGDQEEKIDGEG